MSMWVKSNLELPSSLRLGTSRITLVRLYQIEQSATAAANNLALDAPGSSLVRWIEMEVDRCLSVAGKDPAFSQQFFRDLETYGFREALVYLSNYVGSKNVSDDLLHLLGILRSGFFPRWSETKIRSEIDKKLKENVELARAVCNDDLIGDRWDGLS